MGFCDEEYEIYADVMNRLAIEELAAKRSGMTQSEKDARVSEARAQSIESLRAQLSPTTFEKWHSYHQMRQARIAERRAKMLK